MRAFALALLLLCSMSIVVAQPALAAVVELPVTYIGEVNQEGIDLQGITHRYGWRGALFDYKMAIAAELEDAEPFLFLTIFPYIESLVWYEARLVQYLDGKDDEFAQEYFEQASLYPDALLFQVAVAGDEEMIREDALAFFYEDSTGARHEATIYAHELEEPTFFRRYAQATVWVIAELPDDTVDMEWFRLRTLVRDDTREPAEQDEIDGPEATWVFAR